VVQARKALTRRSLALTLLVALALDGCATYPSAVAIKDQDAATAERDGRECRARAADEASHPMATGLGIKLGWALAGAGVGALAMVAAGANQTGTPPEGWALGIAGGAGLGFIIGTIVGTVKGADEASRAARARERAFTSCMTERGYRLEM